MRWVWLDVVALVTGYAAAVVTLLLWPDRPRSEPTLVFTVGGTVMIIVVVAIEIIPWKGSSWRTRNAAPKRPRGPSLLEILTMTAKRPSASGPRRPLHYRIPFYVFYFGAWSAWLGLTSNASDPDRGFQAFVVGMGLLIIAIVTADAADELWRRRLAQSDTTRM